MNMGTTRVHAYSFLYVLVYMISIYGWHIIKRVILASRMIVLDYDTS